jgi:integrase/recombinase XerD
MGMNWNDLALLRWENNIADNRIEYIRKKTRRIYSIAITPLIESILNQYKNPLKKNGYIFPIVTQTSPERVYKEIRHKNHIFNDELKLIAKEAKLDVNMTSYVSRHSWASIAKQMKVPIAVISEGLGHENQSTTEIYLDQLDYNEVDSANVMITQ